MGRNGKRTNKFLRDAVFCTLAALLAVQAAPMTSLAEENVVGPSGTGYPRSKWDKLMDNVLEYDEIPDLVHEFNTNISRTWDKLQDTQRDMENYIQELESHELKVSHLKDDAKDKRDIESSVIHNIQEDTLGTVIASFRESSASMLISKGTVNQIKKGESQIVMAVQSLMISYDSLMKQKATLDHMAQLYDEQYKIAVDKQTQGLATASEVSQAQVNQLSAASLSANISSALLQMKPTLCTLTGWSADADPVFGPIPDPDLSEIDGINLEEDTRKAIGNNSMLIEQRTSAKGKTTDGIAARLAYINEGDARMTIKMQSLHQDLLSKKAAYEAACDGYGAALRDRDRADRMYQLGSVSRSDYLGMQLAYYQADAAYETARTNLRLAVETYHWAVKGLVNPD